MKILHKLIKLLLNIIKYRQKRKKKKETIMPAGVSWGQYIIFFSAAMVSMFAGAQLVHMYYQPLKDLDKYVEKEKDIHDRLNVFNKKK